MAENFKGIYELYEVDKKSGDLKQIMKRENHLTPQLLGWIRAAFSAPYNKSQSKDFCDGGSAMATSGLTSYDTIGQYADFRYLANNMSLYGLSSTPSNPNTLRWYPYLNDKLEVDDTQITFIGDDNTSGAKYANKIPNPTFNLGGSLLSRSWKLTGPKGQGTISTLCLGKSYHKTLGNSTDSSRHTEWYNYPALVADVVETGVVDDSGVTVPVNTWMQPGITGVTAPNELLLGYNHIPYMKITFDSTGKGVKSRIDNTNPLRKFRMCKLGCGAIDMITFYIGSDYNYTGFKCLVSDGAITNYADYSTVNNRFKKGSDLLITNVTEFGYEKAATTSIVAFHSASTGANDTTTFGNYYMTYQDMITNGKVVGLPSWFNFTGLGTRQDNDNWLLLDNYKCIVIECTDLLDIENTWVNTYFSDTLTNFVIEGELYFSPSWSMSDFAYTNSSGLTGGGSSAVNNSTKYMQVRKAKDSTPMYSILTDVKDNNGQPIVQTEDSEYIFTFSIALGNPS